jgi:hypothetical protein
MWFFTRWEAPGSMTLVCFDLPSHTLDYIRAELAKPDLHGFPQCATPYSILATVVDGVAGAYNDSVWSIRNQISRREAVSNVLD